MKKKIAFCMSIAMALTLFMAFPQASLAAVEVARTDMGGVSTQTIDVDEGGPILTAVSNNPSIANVSYVGKYYFTVTSGTASGEAKITVTIDLGEGKTQTIVYPIAVTGKGSESGYYYSGTIGNSGGIFRTQNKFSKVVRLKSTNENVAVGEWKTDGPVLVIGKGEGKCTITGEVYNDSVGWTNVKIDITVLSSLENKLMGGMLTLRIDEVYESVPLLDLREAKLGNTDIAKIDITPDGRFRLVGLKEGETSLYYSYRDASSEQYKAYEANVIVKGTMTVGSSISLPVDSTYEISHYFMETPRIGDETLLSATLNMAKNKMTLKGLRNGSTTVNFSYRDSATGESTYISIPVVVGTGSSTTSVVTTVTPTPSPSNASTPTPSPAASSNSTSSSTNTKTKGIYIPTRALTVEKGKTYMLNNLLLDGKSVKVEALLWLSSNTKVVTVGSTTGKYKAVAAGTSKLICVDKNGKYVNYATITVK